MWLPFLALDSYVAFEYRDAVSPLVNGYGLYGLVVDPHRGVVEDVEDQYCVRCYLEFKVAPVCNIGMHHGPLLNPNRPFAKPKNIDSLNGFGIYCLLDEDTSRIQVFLIPARANQLNRRKSGKSALLNHSFEVIEERRGIFREHLLEMILTYPGRMSLPRQCFDDVHNRSKYTQKKSINQITFANLTANASVSDMKIGEMLGFYSSNGGSTSGPGASPLFGYIQKTSSSQVNIFAYTIDGKKSWLGYSAGSNVTWTPVGGASGGAPMLSRVDINDFGDYDTLHAILEQTGDMVAIFADYPTNDPSESTGAYVGTAQFDNDYSDAIIYDVLNLMTNTRYQGYVSSAGQVVWTDARGAVKETISIADFTPASLFSSPYNFHLYPSGTMIPIEGSQQANQGPFPGSIYETAGYIMVQYGDNYSGSALRQVMVVLYEVGTIAGQPGRMAYATISKGGLYPRWQIIGGSQWLWTGDMALSANVTASLPLTDYTRRTGDRLEIYYAYLGGGTEGHIMGFNNAVSVLYNPAETLTQSFYTLVTSGGSASQLEAQFEFRMSGSNLQITGRNLNTGSVNVVSKFRIKGVKLVR